jgi:hypothetical protein
LNPHRRSQTLTAWIGLIAIWLMVFAPLASQLLTREAPPATIVCSAIHPSDAQSHEPSKATHHLDACGYCSLLAHCPALGGTSTPLAFSRSALGDQPESPHAPHAQSPSYRRGLPRAPPTLA